MEAGIKSERGTSLYDQEMAEKTNAVAAVLAAHGHDVDQYV